MIFLQVRSEVMSEYRVVELEKWERKEYYNYYFPINVTHEMPDK